MRSLLVIALAWPAVAQDSLSLKDAVERALVKHPSVEASKLGVEAAGARVAQARAAYLPKLNYSESLLRTDNPVMVFSSLLTQHQFSAANFNIGPLNRPDALNNFQSQVVVDQVVYDAGQTRRAVRSAELDRNINTEGERGARMQVIASVVRAYHGAVLADEGVKVADEALRSAEADLNRAEAVRATGMSTDADVLSIRVHLAAMREQQIRRTSDLEVALAALNEAIGLPLPEIHTLSTPLTPARLGDRGLEAYEKDGADARPELRQSKLAAELAGTQADSARASLLPQIIFHAGFEADRQTFATRGGASWLASASLRWNIFNGGADKARIDEAEYGLSRARALTNQADAQIRLQVRRAWADVRSSTQRIEVAQGAVAMAEESLRITKNRFEAGLATVTDLLRTETALLEARDHHLAAVYDQRVAAVNLELAAGRLTPASEVLN